MSDQVEIVAAEEAPSNTEIAETIESTESSPEAPVATTTAALSEAAPEAEQAVANAPEVEAPKSNVRILSVGQQVTGTVKRIADFGAFVDIGVGRDGLIHISELSVRRVGKVTDVLSEG